MTLEEAMARRDITPEVLAAALGVPQTRVIRWITGQGKPHPFLYPRLRELLGLTWNDFNNQLKVNL